MKIKFDIIEILKISISIDTTYIIIYILNTYAPIYLHLNFIFINKENELKICFSDIKMNINEFNFCNPDKGEEYIIIISFSKLISYLILYFVTMYHHKKYWYSSCIHEILLQYFLLIHYIIYKEKI